MVDANLNLDYAVITCRLVLNVTETTVFANAGMDSTYGAYFPELVDVALFAADNFTDCFFS